MRRALIGPALRQPSQPARTARAHSFRTIQVVTGVHTNQSNMPWMVTALAWLSTSQPWQFLVSYAPDLPVFSGA